GDPRADLSAPSLHDAVPICYSFSTWRFHLRGLPVRGGFDVGWVRDLKVGALMRSDAKTVDIGIPVARLRGDIAGGRITHVFTVADRKSTRLNSSHRTISYAV